LLVNFTNKYIYIYIYIYNSYLRFCVQSDDGYMQPKHVADLHRDKFVFRLWNCIIFLLMHVSE